MRTVRRLKNISYTAINYLKYCLNMIQKMLKILFSQYSIIFLSEWHMVSSFTIKERFGLRSDGLMGASGAWTCQTKADFSLLVAKLSIWSLTNLP